MSVSLFTVIVSLISAVTVALLNTLWQRWREESKLIREKGERSLTLMNQINNVHEEIYKLFAIYVRNSDAEWAINGFNKLVDKYDKSDVEIMNIKKQLE